MVKVVVKPSSASITCTIRMLLLVLINYSDLLRARTSRIKSVSNPLFNQLLRHFCTHNPLSHTQHLRVITQHAPFHTVRVVRRDGSDAGDLVSADGDAQARSADQQCSVDLAIEDEFGGCDGDVGVSRFVVGMRDADIDDGRNEWVRFERGFEGVLECVPSIVASDCYANGLGSRHVREVWAEVLSRKVVLVGDLGCMKDR